MLKNNAVAAAMLVFVVAFLWKMQPILHAHTCWCDFQNPNGFAEVLEPIIYGLMAMGFALGVNVKKLITQFMDNQE